MRTIIPVVAACIIKQYPLRILLHQKDEPRNPELVGKWEFPGGMMEYREEPEEALTREVHEELGDIIIQINHLLYAQSNIYTDGKHYLILFYECQTGYEATPDGCRWVDPHDVQGLDCLPGTYEVIRRILTKYSNKKDGEG